MERVNIIAQALYDKKASQIDVLKIAEVSSIADYFIIASCQSAVQVRACADNVEEKLSEAGISCTHREGYSDASWILLDYGDIVVHVMQDKAREFYALERLWDDAPRIDVELK